MMHNNMYYPQSNGQESCYDYEYYGAATTDPYSYNNYNSTTSSSNLSYVDCTLSLGTPSTRSDTGNEKSKKQSSKRSGSRLSNFCWDLLQQTTTSSSSSSKLSKSGRDGGGGGGNGDPLVARRCANCDTTSTPLWRNGPKGPKSLCNACGIRYKKEERRASAAASANSNMSGASAMESQYGSGEHYYSNSSYTTHNYNHHQTQKMNCLFPAATNEYRYMEADDTSHYEHAGNGAVSFLPWMMNVADRPSLVHDFTR